MSEGIANRFLSLARDKLGPQKQEGDEKNAAEEGKQEEGKREGNIFFVKSFIKEDKSYFQ